MKRKITITDLIIVIVVIVFVVNIFRYIKFAPSSEPYIFVKKWNTKPPELGDCKGPVSIATSLTGDIVYIGDRYNEYVQKFDSNGNFISRWTTELEEDITFDSITDISIDSEGKTYTIGDSVKKFDVYGKFIEKWNNKEEICTFRAIEISPKGYVYLATLKKVHIYNLKGDLIDTWNWEKVFSDGEEIEPCVPIFEYMTDISLDQSGYLYLVTTSSNDAGDFYSTAYKKIEFFLFEDYNEYKKGTKREVYNEILDNILCFSFYRVFLFQL